MAESPPSAEEIAHRGFPSAFRGFDPAEVRAYLVRVSNELKAAAARERELRQKLTEAERRAANPVIDQAMLTRALGEETSRVLVSAQEAARQLQARAEEGVARILRDAHEQAQRIRAEAEVVLADRTEEADAAGAEIRAAAQAEAAALVDQARREAEAERAEVVEQSRQLVHEAQAARARVLGDLTRRRRIAHTQVEQLRAGRERLLDAYRVVRRTLDEVADELERVESEARSAAGAAARRVEAALDAGDVHGDEGDAAGVEPTEPLSEQPGVVEPAPARAVAAPTSSDVLPEPAGEAQLGPAPLPSERSELASPQPVTRTGSSASASSSASPVVAREERVEERKLSSLRILRRSKGDAAPGPEREVLEAPSGVEGVRVIPASAPAGESPPVPVPTPPRGERDLPSVMPGVSWAPAPPVPTPAPAASAEPAGSSALAAPPTEPALPALVAPAAEPVAAPASVAAEGDPGPSAEENSPAPAPDPASPVEALFARIRAASSSAAVTPDPAGEAPPTAASSDEKAPPPAAPGPRSHDEQPPPAEAAAPPGPSAPQDEEESLLQRRDEAIESIETALARKLKRALQDEHNDVLDRLRSLKGAPTPPAVLPSPADQAARYAAAAGELLAEAARSGARFVAQGEPDATPTELDDVVADLTEALVGPLRRGLERGVESGQEDASVLVDTIGAAYRECKTQRLEGLAADATIAAFSRGTVSAVRGAHLRWIVDDGDAACPDCDDNALAGPTPSGERYPTGQSHPPAHAGCRCLLVPRRP